MAPLPVAFFHRIVRGVNQEGNDLPVISVTFGRLGAWSSSSLGWFLSDAAGGRPRREHTWVESRTEPSYV